MTTEATESRQPVGVSSSEGLAGRIRSARKAWGMTQAELASASGMERTSVVNIESGRQDMPVRVLLRVATALKMKPGELLDDPGVCCGRFDTCRQPCVPRAGHWQDRATELQAEVHKLAGFIARQAVEQAG